MKYIRNDETMFGTSDNAESVRYGNTNVKVALDGCLKNVDVTTKTPVDGDFVMFNSNEQKWINHTMTISTVDIGAGSELPTGDIYLVYEE